MTICLYKNGCKHICKVLLNGRGPTSYSKQFKYLPAAAGLPAAGAAAGAAATTAAGAAPAELPTLVMSSRTLSPSNALAKSPEERIQFSIFLFFWSLLHKYGYNFHDFPHKKITLISGNKAVIWVYNATRRLKKITTTSHTPPTNRPTWQASSGSMAGTQDRTITLPTHTHLHPSHQSYYMASVACWMLPNLIPSPHYPVHRQRSIIRLLGVVGLANCFRPNFNHGRENAVTIPLLVADCNAARNYGLKLEIGFYKKTGILRDFQTFAIPFRLCGINGIFGQNPGSLRWNRTFRQLWISDEGSQGDHFCTTLGKDQSQRDIRFPHATRTQQFCNQSSVGIYLHIL